jgi:mono/diheme cytochrome c family protein
MHTPLFSRRAQRQARPPVVQAWRLGLTTGLTVCGVTVGTVFLWTLSPLGAEEVGRGTPEYLAPFIVPVTKAGDLQVERGRYLVTLEVCHDCHTPKGADGRPQLDRLMSGHPEDEPPAPAIPGVITACLTATCFTGPWGTSFARNLTPDSATGIGYLDGSVFHQGTAHGEARQRRAAPSPHALGVVQAVNR